MIIELKNWLKKWYKVLKCKHEMKEYRLGRGCKKCGLFYDNVWY